LKEENPIIALVGVDDSKRQIRVPATSGLVRATLTAALGVVMLTVLVVVEVEPEVLTVSGVPDVRSLSWQVVLCSIFPDTSMVGVYPAPNK
jgi:hypothetical protein